MACTACLVCLVSAVSGRSKKAKNALGRDSSSSRHTTKLEQSRFSLDIYEWLLTKQSYEKNSTGGAFPSKL
jgi:hypothetical protein